MQYKIINANNRHIAQITSIYKHSVENEPASWEYIAPSQEEMTARMNDIISRKYPYLVAINGDEVLGYAYASTYHGREGWRFCVEDSIYIAPQHKYKGIGKALLDALMSECHKRGFKDIIAVISTVINQDAQENPSVRLHKKCGFELAGKLKSVGTKFDKWFDIILMQAKLS